MLENRMVIIVVAFFITMFILNAIRWVVSKQTSWEEPKHFYWYLFVISWVIAYILGWILIKP